VYDVPPERPTHHFAWLYADGETHAITRVRRNVLERHPQLYASLRRVTHPTGGLCGLPGKLAAQPRVHQPGAV
jgi:hypothetical protein